MHYRYSLRAIICRCLSLTSENQHFKTKTVYIETLIPIKKGNVSFKRKNSNAGNFHLQYTKIYNLWIDPFNPNA